MTTRRDFLRLAALVPMSGTFGLPLPPSDGWTEAVNPAQEPLYIGKTMKRWIAKMAQGDIARNEYEVIEPLFLHKFGEAAVPGLIEGLNEEDGHLLSTELVMLASPSTIRALICAVRNQPAKVRMEAQFTLNDIARKSLPNQPELAAPLSEAIPVLTGILKREQSPIIACLTARFLHDFGPLLDPAFSFPCQISDYGNVCLWTRIVCEYPEFFPEEATALLLSALLGENDVKTRLAAAEALSVLRPDHPGIVPLFVEYAVRQKRCLVPNFSNLDRFIEKALPLLRDAIHDADPRRRAAILYAVAWSKSAAVLPTIAEMLQDPDKRVRLQAANCLFSIMEPVVVLDFISLLIPMFQDPSAVVRKEVRWGFRLRHSLAVAALPELVTLLNDGNVDGRVGASLAVYDLGDEGKSTMPALRRNLEHDNSNVRVAAAIALARLEPGSRNLLPLLVKGIGHPDEDVRERAVSEIRKLGPEAKAVLPQIIAALPYAWDPKRQSWIAWQQLLIVGHLGPDAATAIPTLVQALADQRMESNVARQILVILGMIGPAAIGSLMKVVRSGDLMCRRRAIEALGLIGPPAKSLVPMFVELLKSGPPVMRITAAEALGNIGPDAAIAIPELKRLQGDRDILLRKCAEEALSRIEGKSSGPCERVREAAGNAFMAVL